MTWCSIYVFYTMNIFFIIIYMYMGLSIVRRRFINSICPTFS